jgi:hypothetical protein
MKDTDLFMAEELALKTALKGMAVTDNENVGRPVGVWFGQPDMEITAQTFPYVTIDMIDMTEAKERMMVSHGVKPWYYTMDVPALADDWTMPYPIPINLDYQITTYARNPRHDRQILAQILGNRLPFRFGSLVVHHSEVFALDGSLTSAEATVRRLDMLSVNKRDTIESGKRMFMNMFTVRISSEITQTYIAKHFYSVQQVNLTDNATYPSTFTSPDLISTITIP